MKKLKAVIMMLVRFFLQLKLDNCVPSQAVGLFFNNTDKTWLMVKCSRNMRMCDVSVGTAGNIFRPAYSSEVVSRACYCNHHDEKKKNGLEKC